MVHTPTTPVGEPGAPPTLERAGVVPARRVAIPRWRDRRVVVGLLLVVVSMVGVVTVVSRASTSVEVWAYRVDLAAGSQVTAEDVTRVAVRVPDPAAYLSGEQSPVGETTARVATAGELVSAGSLVPDSDTAKLRLVTLPVERHHLPIDLQRGESVDVYVVERGVSGEPIRDPRLVLVGATVAEVDDGDSRFGGSSLELGVALSVDAVDVEKLVAAEATGTITLVRVPGNDA